MSEPKLAALSPDAGLALGARCRAIELIVLDVDGVLTDGSIVYADNDVEVKAFFVRDGSALKVWHQAGKQSVIITGRTSRVVDVRAAELGIGTVIQGASDKLPAYRRLLQGCGLKPEQACCVGDDIPDLPLLRNCGLAAAPADACSDVVADAHYVTQARGGRGAVREVIELILRSQGHWQKVVEQYRSAELGTRNSEPRAGNG